MEHKQKWHRSQPTYLSFLQQELDKYCSLKNAYLQSGKKKMDSLDSWDVWDQRYHEISEMIEKRTAVMEQKLGTGRNQSQIFGTLFLMQQGALPV